MPRGVPNKPKAELELVAVRFRHRHGVGGRQYECQDEDFVPADVAESLIAGGLADAIELVLPPAEELPGAAGGSDGADTEGSDQSA